MPDTRKFSFLIVLLLLQIGCGRNDRSVEPRIVSPDPELIQILPKGTRLERLVDGLGLLEGPVWDAGRLFFSDMRSHIIYEWHPVTGLSVFLRTGSLRSGPNGLAFDKERRLTICEHGNRRVSRLEKDGSLTILAESYHGKRLNSPNDLVFRSDGLLYFTDPPYGLKGAHADPKKELAFSGIFLLSNGNLQLLTEELSGPNGLTFSPDEKYLYIGNDNQQAPVIYRYRVEENGSLSKGELFFNATSVGATYLDGMKSDIQGNLYVDASSGIIILSPAGKHLGTLQVPQETTNVAWGDDDQKALYITTAKSLYRIRLKISGTHGFLRAPVSEDAQNSRSVPTPPTANVSERISGKLVLFASNRPYCRELAHPSYEALFHGTVGHRMNFPLSMDLTLLNGAKWCGPPIAE